MSRRLFPVFLLACLLVVGNVIKTQATEKGNRVSLSQEGGTASGSEALLTTGGPDEYGYVWDDAVPYNWVDPSGATTITFSSPDNAYAGPFNIGFSFPFYEFEYTELFISTNGIITFGGGGSYHSNREIPSEIVPNSFIAPFWDNLYVAGEVSYLADPGGTYFAIHFINVTHEGNPLTFQVILYPDGNILFQYADVNGDISNTVVGIEDSDGLDGLSYPSLLQNNLAILFEHPGEIASVKNIPQYASHLAQFGQYNFTLHIRNTGEVGPDIYNLSASFVPNGGNSGWLVSFWRYDNQNTLVPLTNTDGDEQSLPDTGTVLQGDTISITVRLQSPDATVIGDYTSFDVVSKSSLDPSRTSTTRFQTAVPARHFMAYGNSAGLDLARIGPMEWYVFDNIASFGDNPSLVRHDKNYSYVWEYDDFNPGTELEYSVIRYNGQIITPTTKLTDNSTASLLTFDRAPYSAVAPNGRVGVVWVRSIFDPATLGWNYNVYLAVLGTQGEMLVPPTNVTDNTDWQTPGAEEVPTYVSPTISATKDNRFILGWIDSHILSGEVTTDLEVVLFNTEGAQISLSNDLRTGFPGAEQFSGPKFIELPGSRFFAIYSVQTNPTSSEFKPTFGVFSLVNASFGNVIQKPTPVEGTNGRYISVLLLENGNLFAAWTNTEISQIQYAGFDATGIPVSVIPNSIKTLLTPDGRRGDYASMTMSDDGDVIIGWLDLEVFTRVYYALIAQQGNSISPPVFSWFDNESVVFSRSGQSLASAPSFTINFPVVFRP